MGRYKVDQTTGELTLLNPSINDIPIYQGVSGSTMSVAGLVPQAQAGDEKKALLGNGTWGTVGGGEANDNFRGTWEQWNALTPAEQAQYNTRDIIGDFNGQPVDDELSTTSENPVQNKIITGAVNTINAALGDLTDLDTTAKNSVVAAINELVDLVIRNMPLTRTTASFSSLPFTYYDTDIEPDMTTTWWYASNSAAQTSEWTVTPAAGGGSVTISGSGISGRTTVTFTLQRTR